MHGFALALVLVSAVLHATWNALLKSGTERPQFMASMSLVVGVTALLATMFVPFPGRDAWVCIAVSAVLHIGYNLLLLAKYSTSDFAATYPMSRGSSPLLVALAAFLLLHQRLNGAMLAGVAMVSGGILLIAMGRDRIDKSSTFAALWTGATIAAYTVTDSLGVERAHNAMGYSMWIFASYLLMPLVLRGMRFRVRVSATASLPTAAMAGLFSLAAYTIVLWATQYVRVGIVSAMRETSVLWALVIGFVFLGERFTWRRAISAAFICIGIVFLLSAGIHGE